MPAASSVRTQQCLSAAPPTSAPCRVRTHLARPTCNCLQGKVRDTYDLGDKVVLVTSDRQSAFDRHLASIPFKGQVGTWEATYHARKFWDGF